MKNKAIGFYFACIAAVLTVVTLVMTMNYQGQGGQVQSHIPALLVAALVCEASLFLGEKAWTDFTSIGAPVLLAVVLMTVISDGIWNIAESINGIKMLGIPELAGMNITMAAVNGAAIVAAIISSFTKKSK